MSKKGLSEIDDCNEYVTPAMLAAGWNLRSKILREVSFTDGRILVRRKTHTLDKKRSTEYISRKPGILIPIIEAKNTHPVVDVNIQQVLGYADILQILVVLSTSDDGPIHYNKTGFEGFTGKEVSLEEPKVIVRQVDRLKSLYDTSDSHNCARNESVEELLKADALEYGPFSTLE